MPEKLFDLAEKEHILVGFFDLSWNILGVYYSVEPDMPVILLHKKIMHQRRLLRCIFAEELGHHFTTGFDLMAFARTDKKYIAMKYEKMAVFWAVEYLMPLDKLIEVVNSGLFLTHEIAEFFDITERFAGTGIKLYFEKRKNYILKHLPEEME
jgi:Zn-dependent peptidase ImmA (M78 family)